MLDISLNSVTSFDGPLIRIKVHQTQFNFIFATLLKFSNDITKLLGGYNFCQQYQLVSYKSNVLRPTNYYNFAYFWHFSKFGQFKIGEMHLIKVLTDLSFSQLEIINSWAELYQAILYNSRYYKNLSISLLIRKILRTYYKINDLSKIIVLVFL